MSPSRGPKEQEGSSWLFPEWSFLARQELLDTEPNDDGNDNEFDDDQPMSRGTAATIAACFLMDYEAGRPPTLAVNFRKICDYQLKLYQVEFSTWWRWLGLYPATLFIFFAYFQSRILMTILHFQAVMVFLIDIYIRHRLYRNVPLTGVQQTERLVHRATLVFLILFGIQSLACLLWAQPEEKIFTVLVSLFKPLIFFYLSRRAREALEALFKIGTILARVVLIELFLILAFAAVACRLYYNVDGFSSLAVSWLSLFQRKLPVVLYGEI